MAPHSDDRKTAAKRDGYSSMRAAMARDVELKRDHDERVKNAPPTAKRPRIAEGSIFAGPVKPKPPPPVPKSVFQELGGTANFGAFWLKRSAAHVHAIGALLRDVLTSVNHDLPTIVCPLILDADVWAKDNGGATLISDLPFSCANKEGWVALMRRVRKDPVLQDIVIEVARKYFGVRALFHTFQLSQGEVFTFEHPVSFTICPSDEAGFELPIMTLCPEGAV